MKPTNYQSDCSKPIVNGGNTNSVYIKNVNNLIETDKKQTKVIRDTQTETERDRERQRDTER